MRLLECAVGLALWHLLPGACQGPTTIRHEQKEAKEAEGVAFDGITSTPKGASDSISVSSSTDAEDAKKTSYDGKNEQQQRPRSKSRQLFDAISGMWTKSFKDPAKEESHVNKDRKDDAVGDIKAKLDDDTASLVSASGDDVLTNSDRDSLATVTSLDVDSSANIGEMSSVATRDAIDDIEPRIVATTVKQTPGYRRMTYKVGGMELEVLPLDEDASDVKPDRERLGATKGGKDASTSRNSKLGDDEGNPKIIVTGSGRKYKMDEILTFRRTRYIYTSLHMPLWQRILPTGGHQIEDDAAATAMQKLLECLDSRRPMIRDNMYRVLALENRLNQVTSTLRSRLNTTGPALAIHRTYQKVLGDFTLVLSKATTYFRGLSDIVSGFLGRYTRKQRRSIHKSVFFVPIKAQTVYHEVDRCQQDETYGTLTSIRACLHTWELAIIADMYEIEATIDRIWLNRFEFDGSTARQTLNNLLAQLMERTQPPPCLSRLQRFDHESQIKAALMEMGADYASMLEG